MNEDIDIKIEIETGDSVSKLDDVIKKLKTLYATTEVVTDKIGKMNSAFMSIENSTKGVQAAAEKVSDSTKNLSKNLTPDTSGIENAIAPINEMGDTLKNLLRIEQERDQAAAKGKAENEQNARIKKIQKTILIYTGALRKATDTTLSFVGATAKMGFKGLLTGMFGGAAKSIKEMGTNLRNLMKNLSKYTLALYGVRSAFYAVRSVTNEYLNSQNLAAQQLKVNMDYIKYALGSMLAPIMEYVTNLMYKFLQLIQSVVFYFTKVNIFANSTSKGLGGAASAAKELKKQMQGFDELNNIDFGTSAGGGGGAAGATLDLSEIKPLFPNFDDVGIILAEKINSALERIDWDKIQNTVAKGAQAITDFFNDFTRTIDGELIGRSLAQAFNTALIGLDIFFQGYEWETLGNNLAKGLSGIVNNLDWNKLGKQLTNGFRAQILTLYGFIEGFKEWDKLGQKLGDMINSSFANIPWDKLGKSLGDGFVGILTTLNNFLATVDWEQIGRDIGTLLSNIDWVGILTQVFQTVGQIAKGLFEGIWGFLDSGTEAKVITGIATSFVALSTALKGVDKVISKAEELTKIGEITLKFGGLEKIIKTVTPILKTFSGALLVIIGTGIALSNFFDMLNNGFSWLNEILMVVGIAIAAVGATILGVPAGIAAAVGAIIAAIGTLVVIVKEHWEEISNFIITVWETVSGFFAGIFESIYESVKPVTDEIAGAFSMAWEVIKLVWDKAVGFFKAIWEDISYVYSPVADFFKGLFSDAWEAIKSVWNIAVSFFDTIWVGIKGTFSVVGSVLGGFFETAWTTIKTVWNTAVNFFATIWAGIKAVFAVVKGVLTGDFNDAWEAIKNVWSKVKTFFQGVWEGIKSIFGSVASWFKDVFSKAWQAVKNVFSAGGQVFQGIKEGIEATLKTVINAIIRGINTVIAIPFKALNNILLKLKQIDIMGLQPFSWISTFNIPQIPTFAEGGYPDEGQLFIAREAGAEMVGNIGNRTAVANNEQITTAIAKATYEAVSRALSEKGDTKQPISVYVGNKKLYEGYGEYSDAQANKYGTRIIKI